ncbi:hypothetical protein SVAN01_11950 [Stagonosporopsis vannaccii]|nr:hypothetical protein SVAN01_11950 [Stagonosporopsis vannaccii]
MEHPRKYFAYESDEEVSDDCGSVWSCTDNDSQSGTPRVPPNSWANSPASQDSREVSQSDELKDEASLGETFEVGANIDVTKASPEGSQPPKTVSEKKGSQQKKQLSRCSRRAPIVAENGQKSSYSPNCKDTVNIRKATVNEKVQEKPVPCLAMPNNTSSKTQMPVTKAMATDLRLGRQRQPRVVDKKGTPTDFGKRQTPIPRSSTTVGKPVHLNNIHRDAERTTATHDGESEADDDWEMVDHNEVMDESILLNKCG